MPDIWGLNWDERDLSLSFKFGWFTLGRLRRRGAYAAPQPMLTPPLTDVSAQAVVLDLLGTDIAMAYSCPLAAMPKTLTYKDDCIIYASALQNHYYVDTRGPIDSYYDSFSAKTLSTLRRHERNIAKTCQGPSFRVFRRPEEMAEFLDLAARVSARSYQERMLHAGLPSGEKFLEELRSRAAQKSMRGYLLFVDDAPVAYIYCLLDEGVLLYHITGFDPDQSKLSPGTVLLYNVIKDAFADPDIAYLDLSDGEFQHKQFFASDHVLCGDILYLRRTLANHLLVFAKAGLSCLTDFARRVTKKLHLDATLRQRVRKLFLAARG